MFTRRIIQGLVGFELIRIIAMGFGRMVKYALQIFCSAFPDDIPADDTMGRPVNVSYDVDLVFLSPTKLYNSSSSLTFTGPLG